MPGSPRSPGTGSRPLYCKDAYSPTWRGDNSPLKHSPHGPSYAEQREELQDMLTSMVGSSLDEMYQTLDLEDSDANREPVDEARLLQLRMKYKYKYKYKYQISEPQSPALGEDGWNVDGALASPDYPGSPMPPSTENSDFGDEDNELDMVIPTDEVTGARIEETRVDMQHELDATWKTMAAPEGDCPGSPDRTRHEMAASRDRHMPRTRKLKKLVSRLGDFSQLMEEVKKKSFADAQKNITLGGGGQSMDEKNVAAEEEANARVQRALHEMGEEKVTSQNLMHTTKQYNLVSGLRKRLGVFGNDAKNGTEEKGQGFIDGDWNKSILVSKKKAGAGNLGRGAAGKTFKEFRADPWERKKVKEVSGDQK